MRVTVIIEPLELDDGTPMMYRDCGTHIRLTHDPCQMSEASALALLCARIPRLVTAGLKVQWASPKAA